MPDIPSDGMTRVAWVTSIANIASPTTTELNAGVLLQSFITADGLDGLEPDSASVDTSALDSIFNTSTIGRLSFENTMFTLKKQTSPDTAYTTLARGTAGFIAVRRSIASSTAWASAQALEVYPAIVAVRAKVKPEPNTVERYKVKFNITLTPNLDAAVA